MLCNPLMLNPLKMAVAHKTICSCQGLFIINIFILQKHMLYPHWLQKSGDYQPSLYSICEISVIN